MRLIRLVPCLALVAMLAGCDDQPVGPRTDEIPGPSLTASQDEWFEVWEESDVELFIGCLNDGAGALLYASGGVTVHFRETATPSGNTIVKWKIYYDPDHPLAVHDEAFHAIDAATGTRWDLLRATDTGGDLIAANGEIKDHWFMNEWYANGLGQKFKLHGGMTLMIQADGTFSLKRSFFKQTCTG
jgi:hypothetical protein